jgi:arylsulfatase A-like enzyme
VAVINGALLFLFLSALRIEKALQQGASASLAAWVAPTLLDLGLAVSFASLWCFAGLAPAGRCQLLSRVAVAAACGLLYLLALVDHEFLLRTGTRLDASLIPYALLHLRELSGLLATALDGLFARRLAATGLCFGLGVLQAWRPRRETVTATREHAWVGLAVGVTVLLVGTVHVREDRSPAMRGVTSLLSDGIGALIIGAPSSLPVTDQIYSPPTLVGGAERRPNIVLVILESTRADMVVPSVMPFLAGLAEESVVFDEVYTPLPHTTKALVAILCGMYPIPGRSLRESVPGGLPLKCLPPLLHSLGYRSVFLQTAAGSFENRGSLVQNIGFQNWVAREALAQRGFESVGYFGMDEFAMLEPAISWIRQVEDRPFLITLLTSVSHHPYQTPGRGVPDPAEQEFEHYKTTLRHADRFVGELYRRLGELRPLDDTVFIVLGDHGEAFGEHVRRQHDVVPYEEGLRVPLLLKGPGLGPPRHEAGLRSLLDLLPTLLDLLGADWHGLLPGESLLSSEGHDFVAASCWYDRYCMSLRRGPLKFVFHYHRAPMEVFDLRRDPEERDNIAGTLPPEMIQDARFQMLTLQGMIDLYYRTEVVAKARNASGANPPPRSP